MFRCCQTTQFSQLLELVVLADSFSAFSDQRAGKNLEKKSENQIIFFRKKKKQVDKKLDGPSDFGNNQIDKCRKSTKQNCQKTWTLHKKGKHKLEETEN